MKKWVWIPILASIIILSVQLCKTWAYEIVSPLGITVLYDDDVRDQWQERHGYPFEDVDLNALDQHFLYIQASHGGSLDPSRIILRTKEANCWNGSRWGYKHPQYGCIQAQWWNKYTFNHHMGNDSGDFCGSAWWWELNRSFLKVSKDKLKKKCWAWEGSERKSYCGQYFYNPCQ